MGLKETAYVDYISGMYEGYCLSEGGTFVLARSGTLATVEDACRRKGFKIVRIFQSGLEIKSLIVVWATITTGTDWYGKFSSGSALVISSWDAEKEHPGITSRIHGTFWKVGDRGKFVPRDEILGYDLRPLEIGQMNGGVLGTCSQGFNYTAANIRMLSDMFRRTGLRLALKSINATFYNWE